MPRRDAFPRAIANSGHVSTKQTLLRSRKARARVGARAGRERWSGHKFGGSRSSTAQASHQPARCSIPGEQAFRYRWMRTGRAGSAALPPGRDRGREPPAHLGGSGRRTFDRNMFVLHYTTIRASNVRAACQARPDPPTTGPQQMTTDS
jgi:hypothetical protein